MSEQISAVELDTAKTGFRRQEIASVEPVLLCVEPRSSDVESMLSKNQDPTAHCQLHCVVLKPGCVDQSSIHKLFLTK